MSEGINFSDDLGRCVVMLGLPYANIMSPELKEKMNYYEKQQGSGKGRFYYENLCMKAVNQSIGRAIRHQSDYSCILLLDYRYCEKKNIQQSLPKWISDKLQVHNNYNQVQQIVSKFFVDKN